MPTDRHVRTSATDAAPARTRAASATPGRGARRASPRRIRTGRG